MDIFQLGLSSYMCDIHKKNDTMTGDVKQIKNILP